MRIILLALTLAVAALAQRIPAVIGPAQPSVSAPSKPQIDRKCEGSMPITTGTAIGSCGAAFHGKLSVSADLSATAETAKVTAVVRQQCALLLVLGDYGSLCIPPTQVKNAIWTPRMGTLASRPEGNKPQ